ncbi:MAG: sensor histidine kinase, partial [Planctomycetes bacterium]|nr:sensor histidine kinase [Planctomycetota bacterium]
MKRPLFVWIAFVVCFAVVLGAMGWVSLTAVRLTRDRAEAQEQAALEEKVRLALWRMDSRLTSLVARENARPYFAYSAFHPSERAYTRMFAPIKPGEVLVMSAFLTETSPWVLVHFQIGPDGGFTSPEVPAGNMRNAVS